MTIEINGPKESDPEAKKVTIDISDGDTSDQRIEIEVDIVENKGFVSVHDRRNDDYMSSLFDAEEQENDEPPLEKE